MNDELPRIGEVRDAHVWTGAEWVPIVEAAGSDAAPVPTPPSPAAVDAADSGTVAGATAGSGGGTGNMRKWLIVAAVAAVVVIGAVVYFANSGGSSSTTVYGSFTVYDSEAATRFGCASSNLYPDINSSTTALLKDGTGSILGSAPLGIATTVPSGGGHSASCVFKFTFSGVPTDKPVYSMEVASRGAVVENQSDLLVSNWHFDTSLGQ